MTGSPEEFSGLSYRPLFAHELKHSLSLITNPESFGDCFNSENLREPPPRPDRAVRCATSRTFLSRVSAESVAPLRSHLDEPELNDSMV